MNRICLNCRNCGKVETRQGWGGDEWWHRCKADADEHRTTMTCDRWEEKCSV